MKIIVVGAGKLGYDISRILSEERHDVIVVDKDPEHLKAIASNLDVMTVVGNGASPTTLREINVAETDIMLAVTENDELNMIACMTAKQSGVGMTVARVRNPDYTSDHPLVLSYAHYGIDLIINPEYLAAQEIFRLVHVPMASDIEYFFDGRLSMIGLKIGDEMAISGKHIADIGLNRFTVIAVVRKDQVFIPNGGTQLLSGDTIYVLGRANGFHGLNGLLKLNKDKFRALRYSVWVINMIDHSSPRKCFQLHALR
ncbi:MAG: NAD-binding protein [Bacteroidota bacterium]